MSVDHVRSRLLASLTWTEVAEHLRPDSLILLPVGAVEAHGPHLGLDTDVIIAQAVALSAADRFSTIGVDAWIAPPIWYGVSLVGASFAGTTPVPSEPFRAYLASVLQSLAAIAGSDVVVVNAHLEPVHVEAIRTACNEASLASAQVVHVVDHREPRWAERLGSEFAGGSRHAGSYETSIVLAASPGSVRIDQLAGLEPVWIDLPERLRAGARTFEEAGSAQAYFGNPAVSTREDGEQLIGILSEIVLESYLEARNRH